MNITYAYKFLSYKNVSINCGHMLNLCFPHYQKVRARIFITYSLVYHRLIPHDKRHHYSCKLLAADYYQISSLWFIFLDILKLQLVPKTESSARLMLTKFNVQITNY